MGKKQCPYTGPGGCQDCSNPNCQCQVWRPSKRDLADAPIVDPRARKAIEDDIHNEASRRLLGNVTPDETTVYDDVQADQSLVFPSVRAAQFVQESLSHVIDQVEAQLIARCEHAGGKKALRAFVHDAMAWIARLERVKSEIVKDVTRG